MEDERGISVGDLLRWCHAVVHPGLRSFTVIKDETHDWEHHDIDILGLVAITDISFNDMVNVSCIELIMGCNVLWKYDVNSEETVTCPLFRGLDALNVIVPSDFRIRLTGLEPEPRCLVSYRCVAFKRPYNIYTQSKYQLRWCLHLRQPTIVPNEMHDIFHDSVVYNVSQLTFQAQVSDVVDYGKFSDGVIGKVLKALRYTRTKRGCELLFKHLLQFRKRYREQVKAVLQKAGVESEENRTRICMYAQI